MSQSPPASLSSIEQRLIARVAQRAQTLLEDLRLHVGIPTGGGNAEAQPTPTIPLQMRLGFESGRKLPK